MKSHRARSEDPATMELPSIFSEKEIDEAAARCTDTHNPFRRKERPDPWPLIELPFPRIAARIRELWGTKALDEYLNSLAVVERGSREGFPPEVLAAIMEISRLHSYRFHFDRVMCPWEADVSETKWWAKS
jgi:hypothetical protein